MDQVALLIPYDEANVSMAHSGMAYSDPDLTAKLAIEGLLRKPLSSRPLGIGVDRSQNLAGP